MNHSEIEKELTKLTLFNQNEKEAIKQFISQDLKKIQCQIRKKDLKITPEELVRQLFIYRLMDEYGYETDRFQIEKEISFGREKKRADIVIGNKKDKTAPYIIVELKKSSEKDGKDQLKSYTHATGSPIAIWSNGIQVVSWKRNDPNTFEPLASRIPYAHQTLEEFLSVSYTYLDLILEDEILSRGKTLQKIIKNDMENEVLANAGVDVFEECLKLIMTKLYDESQSLKDKDRVMDLRNNEEPYLDFIERLKREYIILYLRVAILTSIIQKKLSQMSIYSK